MDCKQNNGMVHAFTHPSTHTAIFPAGSGLFGMRF